MKHRFDKNTPQTSLTHTPRNSRIRFRSSPADVVAISNVYNSFAAPYACIGGARCALKCVMFMYDVSIRSQHWDVIRSHGYLCGRLPPHRHNAIPMLKLDDGWNGSCCVMPCQKHKMFLLLLLVFTSPRAFTISVLVFPFSDAPCTRMLLLGYGADTEGWPSVGMNDCLN